MNNLKKKPVSKWKGKMTVVKSEQPIQPVKIGEYLKGFDGISKHPQRSQILQFFFRDYLHDPYR